MPKKSNGTKVKRVGYFYPTSTNSVKAKMPNGGWGVTIITLNERGEYAGSKLVAAFADKDAALKHASELPEQWDKFSHKPQAE